MACAAALGLLVAGVLSCGSPPPVELPDPATGRFLTLEEQRALSGDQLSAYCRLLDAHLDDLRGEIELAHRLNDSLNVVLDSLSGEHTQLNRSARELQQRLVRMKNERKGASQYVVHEGDTLTKLASLFYGSRAEWRKIYNANRERIEDPGAPLPSGMNLIIPQ